MTPAHLLRNNHAEPLAKHRAGNNRTTKPSVAAAARARDTKPAKRRRRATQQDDPAPFEFDDQVRSTKREKNKTRGFACATCKRCGPIQSSPCRAPPNPSRTVMREATSPSARSGCNLVTTDRHHTSLLLHAPSLPLALTSILTIACNFLEWLKARDA